jgi:hypothetical protein
MRPGNAMHVTALRTALERAELDTVRAVALMTN